MKSTDRLKLLESTARLLAVEIVRYKARAKFEGKEDGFTHVNQLQRAVEKFMANTMARHPAAGVRS